MHALASRPHVDWRLRTRTLALGERTLLMGILNVTPDSFSDGGQFLSPETALDHGLQLLDQGADILDLGGESTRPNAEPVPEIEETERVIPILEAILKARPDAILSVDTYHAGTARRAVEAGAEIVNDVSGLLWDERMASTVAALGCGFVLMHTRGTPQQWLTQPPIAPGQVLPLILEDLRHQLLTARTAGIGETHLVLDPGFGFGKRGTENFVLHAQLPQLQTFGLPILVGTSRKGFLAREVEQRQPTQNQHYPHATTASNVAAILAGAHILRVHDIPPTREAAAIADAILRSTYLETEPESSSSPQPAR